MDKLTLLLPHGIMQASIEAETLEEALKLKPDWMYPLPNIPYLWIFRGDAQRRARAKSGDLTLLETSRFAKDLSESESTVTNRLRNLPAEIAEKWLSHKYLQMRQMSWVGRDTPR